MRDRSGVAPTDPSKCFRSDWRTFPAQTVGLVAALAGIALIVFGDAGIGAPLAVVGALLVFSMPVLHDRLHLRRSEAPHATWGANDKGRPSFLGGPRS